jgi:DNA helicase-4
VTVKGLESEFIRELQETHQREIKDERFECPECGGRLIKRNGPYGEFLGCSNYAMTGCRFKLPIHRKNHST